MMWHGLTKLYTIIYYTFSCWTISLAFLGRSWRRHTQVNATFGVLERLNSERIEMHWDDFAADVASKTCKSPSIFGRYTCIYIIHIMAYILCFAGPPMLVISLFISPNPRWLPSCCSLATCPSLALRPWKSQIPISQKQCHGDTSWWPMVCHILQRFTILFKNFHWFSIFSQGADQEHFHWVCFAQVAEAHALKGGAPHSTVVRRVFLVFLREVLENLDVLMRCITLYNIVNIV